MLLSARTRCLFVRILTFSTAYLVIGMDYSFSTFTLYQNAMKEQYNLTQIQGKCYQALQ